MTGETGSAREEAERLVATVLAMAQQSGLGRGGRQGHGEDAGRDDDSIAATGARIVDGLGTLGHTLAGMAGHLTGAGGGDRAGRPGSGAPAGEKAAGEGPAGEKTAGEGSAGGRDDAWRAATTTTGSGGRARGSGEYVRYGWATGSLVCCVCPVCRAIANLRHPSPQSAARLATGAGDLAGGVVSLMRGLSAMSGSRAKPARTTSRPARPAPADPGVAWSVATRAGEGGSRVAEDLTPDEEASPWAAATRTAAREAEERHAAEQAAARAAEKRRAAEQAAARAAEERRAAEAPDGGTVGAAGPGPGVSGIDPDPSAAARAPRTAAQWGSGDDVWAAATADGPAVDHDDAGRARSGEA